MGEEPPPRALASTPDPARSFPTTQQAALTCLHIPARPLDPTGTGQK